jgi:CubicO group peptidase (beta-lactamase class C family)
VFGTVSGVGAYARAHLAALAGARIPGAFGPEVAAAFVQPAGVPGSSRALGWDLMRPTSSCGTRLSARAFGHTGFTGTSLWIDPASDLYVVLLSNRVHPAAGDNDGIQMVRRAVHDAVAAVLLG